MFDNLSERLNKVLKNIRGQGRITEENVRETLREVRKSLIDADVALPVVEGFLFEVREKALGMEVQQSLNPGQAMVKCLHEELIHLLGDEKSELNLKAAPPAVILMAGLQGAGKTTTVAKLAKHLKTNEKKSVLVTSVDIYRPAAIDQLEVLAKEIDVDFFPSHSGEDPLKIARNAIAEAKRLQSDVVIVDTAGRLHIDDKMMDEIKALHKVLNPVETLFVVDSMTGQDAAKSAQAFQEAVPLTGVVLTKTDGDARGGAALSVKKITGKPIKFIGVGEKIEALDVFHPDRVASRILGMGDVLSLIEDVEKKVDKKKAEKLAQKIKKGVGFDFEDFREQLKQISAMGGASGLLGKLPGMGGMMKKMQDQNPEEKFKKIEAMINSMTIRERRFPQLIKGSRKQRIAKGAGRSVPEVNQMLRQFTQMQKMMKKFSGAGGMKKMMRGLQGLTGMSGGMPGGMPGGMGELESMLPPELKGKLPFDDKE
jgi:signal recognition particle subunit SRP54